MKLLRNPITVGLLAVVACALVVHSLYPHLRRPSGRAVVVRPVAKSTSPTPASATPLEKPESSATPIPLNRGAASAAVPPIGMDLDLIHADAERWSQGRRDPFQLRTVAIKPIYPPAREVLFLSAVWRQTDSSLAVLNNKIYAAGDRILRYTINSIEEDRVWVQGPNGREAVIFRSAQTTRTNASQNLSFGATTGVSKNP